MHYKSGDFMRKEVSKSEKVSEDKEKSLNLTKMIINEYPELLGSIQ